MLVAMVLSAGLGILIERFAYRPGRSETRFTLAFWLGILGAAAGQLMSPGFLALALGAAVGHCDRDCRRNAGLRPVKQDSRLALLIIAIGVSLFLENGGQHGVWRRPEVLSRNHSDRADGMSAG